MSNAMTTTYTVDTVDFGILTFDIVGDPTDMSYSASLTTSNHAPLGSPYYEERTEDVGGFYTIDEARDECDALIYQWECAIDDYADREYERY